MAIVMLYLLVLRCIASVGVLVLCNGQLPGHMEPLGSHRPPLNIDTTDTAPDPISFNTDYVKASKPLKFNGLLRDNAVIKNWQDDDYLRKTFGNSEVTIEREKKETRSLESNRMLMSDFLNEYKSKDIYAVGEIPPAMADEWPVPSFLLCGGYTDHLALMYIWFSSGGTKSVLHSDTADNFHCVVSGTKTFVLIDKNYSNVIGPELESQGYYNLDVEAVDMNQYPGLVDVPWYKVVLEPGDCLYLPYLWIHHVDSVGRNLGVNVWWVPFKFDKEDCIESQDVLPDFTYAGNFQASPDIELKWFLLKCQQDDGTIHAKDVLKSVPRDKASVVNIESIQQMMNIVVPNSNGFIRVEELNSVPITRYNEAMDFIIRLENQRYEGGTPPTQGSHHPSHPSGGPPPPKGHQHPAGDHQPTADDGADENWEGGGDGHSHNWDEL